VEYTSSCSDRPLSTARLGELRQIARNFTETHRYSPCTIINQVDRDPSTESSPPAQPPERRSPVNFLKTATAVALIASFVGLQPATALAQGRDRRDRYEDRRDRRADRREARYEARRDYWDASRYYRRNDRRYRPIRLGRNDRIYRGSDDRYYCRRDDGTTGLIVGGITGGVLGHVIAPGGSKTVGAIIGAGAGALIGRAIDDGDVVCH